MATELQAAPALRGSGSWVYDTSSLDVRVSAEAASSLGLDGGTSELPLDHLLALVSRPEALSSAISGAVEMQNGFELAVELGDTSPPRSLIFRGATVGDDGLIAGTITEATPGGERERALVQLASRDPLTGLYNRRRFMEELEREIRTSWRYREPASLLAVDLDGFKAVNDHLGHTAGDRLLTEVASAITNKLKVSDPVGRLGGDEFAVILPRCSARDAERLARKLVETIRVVGASRGSRGRAVTASIGVAPFPSEAAAATINRASEMLIAQADEAMYQAKNASGDRVASVDPQVKDRFVNRLRFEDAVREALARDEFRVHYQPIVSLEDGSVVSCEALVRWQHPSQGLLGAADFVPVAEETGVIDMIGWWVLERACEQAANWRNEGLPVGISVNVSAVQLRNSQLEGWVAVALERTGLGPEHLCLELTETTLLADPERAASALGDLRAGGVRVAIDDFGVGASSLSHLRELPVDVIKIDRSFTQGLLENTTDRAIIAAVISLAREMGLEAIVEGVSDRRHEVALRDLGARFAQGFLYSRPAPPDELELGGFGPVRGRGEPSIVLEFMRQIGIPARIER